MSHTYKIDEYKYPSVTTIISDCTDKSGALTQWAANQVVEWIRQSCLADSSEGAYQVFEDQLENARFHFREVSQEALDVGSAVHHAIEHYLRTGREPKIDHEQAVNGYLAFLEWADKHELETHRTELTVYSNCWAGTLDWYGRLNGRMTVIDFKSSKAIYPEYRYQIAAYRSVVGAEASAILRLDKETGYPEYRDYSKSYEKDLKVFQAMVRLYMLRHPRIAAKAGWEE